jgi:hypothetical protein
LGPASTVTVAYPFVKSKVALATWLPSGPFNCVLILSAPGGAPEDGEVVAWLPFWFAHAANGAMLAVSTAAAKGTTLFMGRAYPICPG